LYESSSLGDRRGTRFFGLIYWGYFFMKSGEAMNDMNIEEKREVAHCVSSPIAWVSSA
jgi:hypothetical protein